MKPYFNINSSEKEIRYMIWRDTYINSLNTLLRGRRLVYLWDLLRELVARDMKVKYKRSVLGIAWSLVNPLLHMLVFFLLFRMILTIKISRYSSFTLTGLLVWNWFQSSLSQAASAITGNRELIRRPGFPATILPVVTVTTSLIHFLLALPILMVVLMMGGAELGPTILALPLVLILQFVLTLSLAYLAASANVIFADTQHLIGVLLQLLFFLTPIFYDTSAIPARYYSLYRLNPMVRLLEAYRAVLIGGMQPDWLSLLAPCLLALGLLFVGYRIFIRVSYRFVEEL
jgi:lipopolysaccharide transport system permease protein